MDYESKRYKSMGRYQADDDSKKKGDVRARRGKIIIASVLLLIILLEFLFFFNGSSSNKNDSNLSSNTNNEKEGSNSQVLRSVTNDGSGDSDNDSNEEQVNEPNAREEKEQVDNNDSPDLHGLVQRVRTALAPFMYKYLTAHDPDRVPPPCNKGYSERIPNTYLAGCPSIGCKHTKTLEEAKALCDTQLSCGGIVQESEGRYEIRESNVAEKSDFTESSWIKQPCDANESKDGSKGFVPKPAEARSIWEAFQETVDKALDDPSLNLRKSYGPPREDNSIFISIASYRDPSCASTVKRAFERADHPENLYVGVVQQNCMHDCMTGTGWAATRQWVKQDHPDPDCIEEFCKSSLGSPHCKAGRVNILRLEEIDSLGPFFTRFLNSKMWRGENFYLQIDAHTDFREGWDTSMIEQMRATPTYPMSVISNYPPGGSPDRSDRWPRATSEAIKFGVPSALCHCTFEDAGGRHMTVRLSEIPRSFEKQIDKSIPHQTSFVAAGFFIAHGSIVDDVQFDPFLPYLFMGEEIVLSIRFWTYGYDIYGPSVDVLKHEYVRSEHPKFWESITMIFSNPGIHNSLTDLVVERVQHLVGFPEALEPEQVEPQSLLTRIKEYSCGTRRSREDYIKHNRLDLVNKKQVAPEWCLRGTSPPWMKEQNKKLRKGEAPKGIEEIDRDLIS